MRDLMRFRSVEGAPGVQEYSVTLREVSLSKRDNSTTSL